MSTPEDDRARAIEELERERGGFVLVSLGEDGTVAIASLRGEVEAVIAARALAEMAGSIIAGVFNLPPSEIVTS